MKLAVCQMAPIWLNKELTLAKMHDYVMTAADGGADLVVFGESLLPGYPFWLATSSASNFNDEQQKKIHAHYLEQAVVSDISLTNEVAMPELAPMCQTARARNIAIVLGCIERPKDRGAHSCYCSLVYIDAEGHIRNIHRKLQPTYEERLCWSPGDGHGLRTFSIKDFTMGALNCWENWMPLPRAALYGAGENLHLALWPGNKRNTEILTRFLAREGRSYCVSVSGLMRKSDIPQDTPLYDFICENFPDMPADGGSCVAKPGGEWLMKPLVGEEGLHIVELDYQKVLQERQNFDPAGHYSRPDVTRLHINRRRQGTVVWEE